MLKYKLRNCGEKDVRVGVKARELVKAHTTHFNQNDRIWMLSYFPSSYLYFIATFYWDYSHPFVNRLYVHPAHIVHSYRAVTFTWITTTTATVTETKNQILLELETSYAIHKFFLLVMILILVEQPKWYEREKVYQIY